MRVEREMERERGVERECGERNEVWRKSMYRVERKMACGERVWSVWRECGEREVDEPRRGRPSPDCPSSAAALHGVLLLKGLFEISWRTIRKDYSKSVRGLFEARRVPVVSPSILNPKPFTQNVNP